MDPVFEPPDWSHDSNIYEVNLRQYTIAGTFEAFSKELPRLRQMGVEILWFMPITPISVQKRLGTLGSYYACSDYISTNPEFGSVEDFKKLVREAQGLGFKILIDWVANHTGWDHHWTREHPDYYKRNDQGNFYDPNGWEDVIDLDYNNPALRRAVIDAMKFWVQECGIDGFRCDMAMLVPLDFWREARTELDGVKKLFWLAECEEISYQEVFDVVYAWRFLHTMEAYWRNDKNIGGIDADLQYYDKGFLPTAMHALFTSNHDENSHSGSEYERMADAAMPFAVLCATWNGIPLIYSGQELPNKKRLKFFDRDSIDWTGDYALNDFYGTLLHLRKRNKALRAGDASVKTFRLSANVNDKVFAFLRCHGENEVLVILNLSRDVVSYSVTDPVVKGIFRNSFSGEIVNIDENSHFEMDPWHFRVLEK